MENAEYRLNENVRINKSAIIYLDGDKKTLMNAVIIKEYYCIGRPIREIPYRNGKLHGAVREYHLNDILSREMLCEQRHSNNNM
jgi:antitoxin component YwqK of YwqJK toxin-antitoxin module